MDEKLGVALARRRAMGTLRTLQIPDENASVDFYSNDYLGFALLPRLHDLVRTRQTELHNQHGPLLGATGSRLISDNSRLFMQVEHDLATFYNRYNYCSADAADDDALVD